MFSKLFGTDTRALQAELAHATHMFAHAMRVYGVLSTQALAYEAKIATLEAALAN
jgi:hypothetical protein